MKKFFLLTFLFLIVFTLCGSVAVISPKIGNTSTSLGIGGTATSTTSSSFVDVVNLSTTIKISGNRPVLLVLQGSNAYTGGGITAASGTAYTGGDFQIVRDTSTVITREEIYFQGTGFVQTQGNIVAVDTSPGGPGSHTYKVQMRSTSSSTTGITNVTLVAVEM